jgi:cbb3-type cytochrome oxidase maturation protein
VTLTWALFLLCFLMGLSAWLIFWWTVRSGQLQDAELTAAEMLELDALEDGRPAHRIAAEKRAYEAVHGIQENAR